MKITLPDPDIVSWLSQALPKLQPLEQDPQASQMQRFATL